jgi:hypothetical protein
MTGRGTIMNSEAGSNREKRSAPANDRQDNRRPHAGHVSFETDQAVADGGVLSASRAALRAWPLGQVTERNRESGFSGALMRHRSEAH